MFGVRDFVARSDILLSIRCKFCMRIESFEDVRRLPWHKRIFKLYVVNFGDG